jgi:hypothetical protein
VNQCAIHRATVEPDVPQGGPSSTEGEWRPELNFSNVSYGKMFRCSYSIRTTAAGEKVSEATLSWGRDLGWHIGKNADGPLVFSLSRFSAWPGDLEMQVLVEDAHGATCATFTASQLIIFPGEYQDLSRAARHFAHGVCRALKNDGALVDAPGLDMVGLYPAQARLARRERTRQIVHRAGLILALCCYTTAWCIDRSMHLFWILAWLFAMLSGLTGALHVRMVGVRALFLLVLLGWCMVVLLAVTVWGVLHV